MGSLEIEWSHCKLNESLEIELVDFDIVWVGQVMRVNKFITCTRVHF